MIIIPKNRCKEAAPEKSDQSGRRNQRGGERSGTFGARTLQRGNLPKPLEIIGVKPSNGTSEAKA